MDSIRKFLKTPAGKVVTGLLVLVGLAAMYFSLANLLGDSQATASSKDRLYICSETGKTFRHQIKAGEKVFPMASPPNGGKPTGYPAEICTWTADGKMKPEGTPVLLNDYVGKPGPTFCPDCGRLVVNLNPPAEPGMKPPPKKDEYHSKGSK